MGPNVFFIPMVGWLLVRRSRAVGQDFEFHIFDFRFWIFDWTQKIDPMVGWLLIRRRPVQQGGRILDFEIWISDFGLWILEWIPKKLTPMVGWLLVRRRPASRVGFWIWNFVFQIFNFGFWIRSQIFQPQWLGGCWLEGGQGSRGKRAGGRCGLAS